MATTTSSRTARATVRRERERAIVEAARELFDESGMDEARVHRIARRAGINKALVYRHFASKEELFALTITSYLDEIGDLLEAIDEQAGDPAERLRRGFDAFARYGIDHPAFLDGVLSLLRRPADELRAELSDAILLRLGRAVGRCIGWLAAVLRALEVPEGEADLRANQLYLQAIGVLHLVRTGVAVRALGSGPTVFPVGAEQVRGACVQLALTGARSDPPDIDQASAEKGTDS